MIDLPSFNLFLPSSAILKTKGDCSTGFDTGCKDVLFRAEDVQKPVKNVKKVKIAYFDQRINGQHPFAG